MSCDWGDCDEPLAAYRWDTISYQWLPVCLGHAVIVRPGEHCTLCIEQIGGCGCPCHFSIEDILDLLQLEAGGS